MSNYNRNNRSGGGYRGRDSGRREMHKAVCDKCGKDCEVPFKPTGGKPIYCSSCFEAKGGGSSGRSRQDSGGSAYQKPDNTNKQLLEQVSLLNVKLDRILKTLEVHVQKQGKVETKTKKKKEAPKKAVKKTSPKTKTTKKKKTSKKSKKKATKKN